MNTVNFIPEDEYARVLEVVPVLCVDVMLFNRKGECLLVKRTNEPLKGQWWVIGGRVHKGETLSQAAIRKIREESGVNVSAVEPVGYYEEVAHINRFGSLIPLHAVSVVFTATIDDSALIKLDDQSSEWKYSTHIPDNFHIKPFPKPYPQETIKQMEI
ncbi:MAG: NUDIX domain-containing protein [Candidatus Omnitrophica bacterium]|nr:NUDIX domain-containing protein [Candidatus Omnitrophota bacterium]